VSKRGVSLTPAEVRLRAEHWRVIQQDADPMYLVALRRFHDLQFGAWRAWFTDLVPPVPRLTTPGSPRRDGEYAYIGGDGLRGEIRIRLSLLTGHHPRMRAGDQYAEGRLRYVEDVLLHECIHAYQHEVAGQDERSYHGHGPAFAEHANLIGAALDLPEVRSAKRRGSKANLPSCAQWPSNVRPRDYYQGASLDAAEPRDALPTPPAPPPVPLLDQLLGLWRRTSRKDRTLFLRLVGKPARS
jgi:hypothetical protein